jgi:hypothetical protein
VDSASQNDKFAKYLHFYNSERILLSGAFHCQFRQYATYLEDYTKKVSISLGEK